MYSPNTHLTKLVTPRRANALLCFAILISLPLQWLFVACASAMPITVDVEQAVIHWRQIGILYDPPGCPPPTDKAPGWKLINIDRPDTLQIPEDIQKNLQGICVYESSRAVEKQDVDDLYRDVGAYFSSIEPDRLVTYPAGDLQDNISILLAESFEIQAAKWPLTPSDNPKPRLVVPDTVPTGQLCTNTNNSSHGYSLCQMAQSFICQGSSACVADIATRLTLAYTAFDPWDPSASVRDEDFGGHVGSVADLGLALIAELAAWDGSQRLVIPLALGWHADYSPMDGDGSSKVIGGLESSVDEMPADVQIVYRALEALACADALVLAAAGNRPDGLQSAGQLLPAAWESRSVICGGETRSLIKSVGGIDFRGLPLANALENSQPARSAYGDHAVVKDSMTGKFTTTLTGTSVSTYVVAATAAAVWHYQPGLSREQVMDHLELYGQPLTDAPLPEVCFEQAACQNAPVRISFCEAVLPVCSIGGFCAPGPCPAPGISNLQRAFLPDASPANLGPPGSMGPSAPGLAAVPWLHPQPGSNPCRSCLIRRTPPPNLRAWQDNPPGRFPTKGRLADAKTLSQDILIEIEDTYSATLTNPRVDVCGTVYPISLSGPCPPPLPPASISLPYEVTADCQLTIPWTITVPTGCTATPTLIFDFTLPGTTTIGTTLTPLLEVQ